MEQPTKFKTKRELMWYILGLKDARIHCENYIKVEEERYESAFLHMEFDDRGNVIEKSTVQPTRDLNTVRNQNE